MKNGTNKRLSAVDAFIILLLIAAVVGVGFKVFAGNVGLFAGEKQEYYVSYVINEADKAVKDSLTEGAQFYTEGEKPFGSVTGEVRTTPAKIYNVNSDGEYVVKHYPDGTKSEIEGTFLVKGTMTDKGLVCADEYLCAGMTLKIYGGGVATDILITDVVQVSQ